MTYKAQVETHDISNKAAVAGLSTNYMLDTDNHHGKIVRECLETQKRELMKEHKPPTLVLPHGTPQKLEDAYYYCILHHLLRYLADERLPSDLQDIVEKMWRDVRPMGRNEAQSTYNRHVLQIASSQMRWLRLKTLMCSTCNSSWEIIHLLLCLQTTRVMRF